MAGEAASGHCDIMWKCDNINKSSKTCPPYIYFSWHRFSHCFIAQTLCILTIQPVYVLHSVSAPLVTHTVFSCKLLIDLCIRGTKKLWAGKEIIFFNLYKPIYLLRLQPTLCHTFRKSVLLGNPQWKHGKPLFKSSWDNYSEKKKKKMWGEHKKKKKVMLLWLNLIQLVSFEWLIFLSEYIVSKGHVTVTRYDWMAMCNWGFIAFWTAELVSDMHGSFCFEKEHARGIGVTENWEGWETDGEKGN